MRSTDHHQPSDAHSTSGGNRSPRYRCAMNAIASAATVPAAAPTTGATYATSRRRHPTSTPSPTIPATTSSGVVVVNDDDRLIVSNVTFPSTDAGGPKSATGYQPLIRRLSGRRY